MTEFVCLDGTSIRLTANSGWGWGTYVAVPPSLGGYKDFPITGTGTKLTVDGTGIIFATDITTDMSALTGEAYHAAAFGVHVGGLDGTLAIVTLLTGLVSSTIFMEDGVGVVLDNISGNFIIGLLSPATHPSTGADPGIPVGFHTGTWAIQSNGGNTKLKSN